MEKKEILQSGVSFKKLPQYFQFKLIEQVINTKTADGQTIYADAETVLANDHFADRTYTIYRWVYQDITCRPEVEEEI